MGEVLGETQRSNTVLETALRIAEEPERPARAFQAAHAGIVAAVDECMPTMLGLVVQGDPVLEMWPRGTYAATPDEHRPEGVVPLEQERRIAGTLTERQQLSSELERGCHARAMRCQ
jgi:hypothetical protein